MATSQATKTLGTAIGAGVKRVREAQGLRQEEVAARARVVGLPGWTAATVAAVEHGRRNLALNELFLIAIALKVSFADLLPTDGDIELAPDTKAPAKAIRRMLTEAPGRSSGIDLPVMKATRVANVSAALAHALKPVWPKLSQEDLRQAVTAMHGEAERKAAAKLGVEAAYVSATAIATWGRSLTDQRDAEVKKVAPPDATPRTLQALRGHITRSLVEEVRAHLPKGAQP